jgi:hypothetical protein
MCLISMVGNFIYLIIVGMWAFLALWMADGAVDGCRRRRLFAVFKLSSYGARGASCPAVMWGLSGCVVFMYVHVAR